ncbi:hypothetical protein HYFRA_00006860 [Hymenoscyphus fraxineus]|uniref:Uncharacterized protein n=1 Tax=Hymenoscyphus fraxineus TaxID=746836 RepID=A0A9N9KRR2_9HELO|nr:hypothetical protein HYFRA_00006860 [Hymenoscyphus fraxineus]
MDTKASEADDIDALLRTSSSGANTPTSTIITGLNEHLKSMAIRNSAPWPGSTYLIRSYNTHQVITLKEGSLVLENQAGDAGGWKWACVEKKGWLGFRNIVSGTYIGHDSSRNFRAAMPHHHAWEHFCVRPHPDGGYLILMLHGDTFWKMCEGPTGDRLVEKPFDGDSSGSPPFLDNADGWVDGVWEFVKV